MKTPSFQPNAFSNFFCKKLKMKTQFRFPRTFFRKMKTDFHNQTHHKSSCLEDLKNKTVVLVFIISFTFWRPKSKYKDLQSSK